jgi:hypothetical protein
MVVGWLHKVARQRYTLRLILEREWFASHQLSKLSDADLSLLIEILAK